MSQVKIDQSNAGRSLVGDWEDYLKAYYDKPQSTRTWSGYQVKEIYTPEHTEGIDYPRQIGDAGDYPYTRGIHRNMYRGKYPTRRIICGFGSARDTNRRLKFNIQNKFMNNIFSFISSAVILFSLKRFFND